MSSFEWENFMPTGPSPSHAIRKESAKYLEELCTACTVADKNAFVRKLNEISMRIINDEVKQPEKLILNNNLVKSRENKNINLQSPSPRDVNRFHQNSQHIYDRQFGGNFPNEFLSNAQETEFPQVSSKTVVALPPDNVGVKHVLPSSRDIDELHDGAFSRHSEGVFHRQSRQQLAQPTSPGAKQASQANRPRESNDGVDRAEIVGSDSESSNDDSYSQIMESSSDNEYSEVEPYSNESNQQAAIERDNIIQALPLNSVDRLKSVEEGNISMMASEIRNSCGNQDGISSDAAVDGSLDIDTSKESRQRTTADRSNFQQTAAVVRDLPLSKSDSINSTGRNIESNVSLSANFSGSWRPSQSASVPLSKNINATNTVRGDGTLDGFSSLRPIKRVDLSSMTPEKLKLLTGHY